VFGDESRDRTAEEQTSAWEAIKAAERAGKAETGVLDGVALGLPALRERIARLYQDWYGLDVDPGRIIVTSGSSAAFLLAFTALFDGGDKVGIASPGYPSYRQLLKALNLTPTLIQAEARDGYQPTPDHITGAGLDGIMVASPANPTGTMLSRPQMQALITASHQAGTAFISDEIYHGLHYTDRAVSALELSDEVYAINSFSKYFSMTGWRIGWMVVPPDHVRRIERLAQHMFICAPHVSQIAALGALEATEELEQNRATYAANRALMLDGLRAAGITRFAPPDGGFYVYADVSHLGADSSADSLTLAQAFLDEESVAVTPGLDFDPVRGRGTWRFSYASSTEAITKGLDRLKRFTARRG
jgi:aspartate/methionine/tyrosine aminotransferase